MHWQDIYKVPKGGIMQSIGLAWSPDRNERHRTLQKQLILLHILEVFQIWSNNSNSRHTWRAINTAFYERKWFYTIEVGVWEQHTDLYDRKSNHACFYSVCQGNAPLCVSQVIELLAILKIEKSEVRRGSWAFGIHYHCFVERSLEAIWFFLFRVPGQSLRLYDSGFR